MTTCYNSNVSRALERLLVHSVWCLIVLIGWAHSLQRLGNVARTVGFLFAIPLFRGHWFGE